MPHLHQHAKQLSPPSVDDSPGMLKMAGINLLLAALYFGLAKLGLLLALPPGYVTAIWPPAGLAFAACLICAGRTVWPGILLGSILANATIGGSFQLSWIAVAIASGSTVQALVGATALRRVNHRMELDDIAAVTRFVIVTLLTCLIAACVGNVSLLTAGFIVAEQIPKTFFTWWFGDTLGVLIFLPLTLVVADPRPIWKQRRLLVGMPLLAAFLLCGLVYRAVRNDEVKRLNEEFSIQAENLIETFHHFDEIYRGALNGLATTLSLAETPNPRQFSRYAATLRDNYPLLTVVEWLPLVRQDALGRFQSDWSAKLGLRMTVSPLSGHDFAADGWTAPVSLIEPLAGNEATLGLDLLSEPVRARAFRQAWQTGQLIVSDKITLVQDADGPGGLLVIAPVRAHDDRRGNVSGFALGVVNLRALLKPLQETRHLSWSLRDVTTGAVIHETLADAPEFAPASHLDRRGVYFQRTVKFADREYKLVLHMPHTALTTQDISLASVVLFLALLTSAALAMFTLIMSANAGRIAREVKERTGELRESEARFALAAAGANDGIWEWTMATDACYLSPRWTELTGYAAHELPTTATDFFLMVHPQDVPVAREATRAHLVERKPYAVEMRLRCKNGEYRWFLSRAQAQWNAQGNPERMAGSVSDITEHKRAQLQLEQLNNALQIRTEQAEQASRTKSRFLATMSHEIRTPLNGVLGMAQLLLMSRVSEEERRLYAQTILDSGKTLLALIDNVLDLSKVEAGRMELTVAPLDPALILSEIATLFSASARQKHLIVVWDWQGGADARYRGDALRLRQMLSNLVSNAIKCADSGRVRIEGKECAIEAGRARLRFTVTDTGIGIAPENLERLFKTFSQVDDSDTRRFGGTGLGLSIVRQLARLMGGEAGVESIEGVGSTFWFEVELEAMTPALAAPWPGRETGALAGSASSALAAAGQTSAATVLVVEDRQDNRLVAEQMLSHLGCAVRLAFNGHEALNILQAGGIDLVIMDCQMPVQNGYQTTRLWRESEAGGTTHLPIIALTASVFAKDREHCREAGMDDFLAKPVSMDELERTLKKWLPDKALASR
jgi:PAS domain S-box-containing protein